MPVICTLYAQQWANHSPQFQHGCTSCMHSNAQTSHTMWSTAVHSVRTTMCKQFSTFEALQRTLYVCVNHSKHFTLYPQQCANHSAYLKHCCTHSNVWTSRHIWNTAAHALHTNHSPHVKHCSIHCMHSNAQTVHHCSTMWDYALSCYQSKERRGVGGGVGLRKGNSKQKENVSTDLLVRFSFGVPCVHGGCDATGQISLVACLAVLQHLTKVVQLTGTLSNTSLTNKN